ncbi:MAG TPA: hypothetical protein VFE57_13590 [Cyclobacteriaceae bacterium]|jgi:hypothetical protein|nr:hypothetical protein [Cyclobacteriaceae bacterium]
MDVLAHMLWTNYGARAGNVELKKKKKRPINLAWATFWGVFPDLVAFGIPIAIAIILAPFHGFSFQGLAVLGWPPILYHYSHSLVIWAVVFLAVWAIRKRIPLELFGWTLHILIDIPSHANNFYPTPFLFPISNYHFTHGIPWSNTWYMIINYSLLLIASLYVFTRRKKLK